MSNELLVTARWRKHTEKPTRPMAAIIAVPAEKMHPNDVAIILLPEIYNFSKGKWEAEDGGERLKEKVFWWLPEDALTLPLEALMQKP